MSGRQTSEHARDGASVLTPASLIPSGRLLPTPIPPHSASSAGSRPRSSMSSTHKRGRNDRQGLTVGVPSKPHSQSVSPNPRHSASASSGTSTWAASDRRDNHRLVRTLPPWVQSAADDDDNDNDHEDHAALASSLLLPRTPIAARPANHNFMPTPKSSVPGRKFDHAREGAPVTLSSHMSEHASKWQQFAKAYEHDKERISSSRGQLVNDEWMKDNLPDLEEPWEPLDSQPREADKGFWLFNKRKRTRFRRNLMTHPMVPLAVRLIVLTFSVMALALAGAIFHKSNNQQCENNSSTWMAILVDVVAIVYTMYITYDEYTSKPLGLRSHRAKMRLVFLDLAFIVFDSANLSLAFQALTDERWVCQESEQTYLSTCPYTRDICTRQKALTATLLIALVAWLGTFTISALRLLERVAR